MKSPQNTKLWRFFWVQLIRLIFLLKKDFHTWKKIKHFFKKSLTDIKLITKNLKSVHLLKFPKIFIRKRKFFNACEKYEFIKFWSLNCRMKCESCVDSHSNSQMKLTSLNCKKNLFPFHARVFSAIFSVYFLLLDDVVMCSTSWDIERLTSEKWEGMMRRFKWFFKINFSLIFLTTCCEIVFTFLRVCLLKIKVASMFVIRNI